MIDLEEYLKENPSMMAVHGTLSDRKADMGLTIDNSLIKGLLSMFGIQTEEIPADQFYQNNINHPICWEDKIEQALKLKPHISGEIINNYETDLWSPIGLVLKGGIITNIGDFSRVLEDGSRIITYSDPDVKLDQKLNCVLDYGEVLFKDPVFSAVYVVKNHKYLRSNPRERNVAEAIAKRNDLEFTVL